jgi:hypothetical protein
MWPYFGGYDCLRHEPIEPVPILRNKILIEQKIIRLFCCIEIFTMWAGHQIPGIRGIKNSFERFDVPLVVRNIIAQIKIHNHIIGL